MYLNVLIRKLNTHLLFGKRLDLYTCVKIRLLESTSFDKGSLDNKVENFKRVNICYTLEHFKNKRKSRNLRHLPKPQSKT